MLTSLLLPTLFVATPVDARVVGASMFKNGYALVVREMKVPGQGEYILDQIPEGSLGTVWLSASDGLKLEEATTEMRDSGEAAPVRSMDELLQANVGKTVRLTLYKDHPMGSQILGVLATADGDIVTVKTEQGTVAILKNLIQGMTVVGEMSVRSKPTGKTRGLRLRVSGGRPGSVYLVALQRGMAWAPNYQLDLSDPKTLKLTAKATVMNDLVDLRNADVRLVAGYPNVPYAGLPDPINTPSVEQFLSVILGIGATPDNTGGFARGGFGGGGIGGGMGGGRAGEMLGQSAGSPQRPFDNTAVGDSLYGERVDDLFFYARPNTTLTKGERSYVTLFTAEAPYRRVHLWNVDKAQRDYYLNWYYSYSEADNRADYDRDVWDELRFKNTSKQPISTGLGIATNGDRMLGQQILPYTAPGQEAEFRVTKALEVDATYETKNIQDFPSKDGRPGYLFREGTITVRNGKHEPIQMQVEKEIVGTVEKAEVKPDETEVAHSYNYQNPLQKLTFKFDIPAGETKTVKFSYRVRHW
jgi:hypothetical protein